MSDTRPAWRERLARLRPSRETVRRVLIVSIPAFIIGYIVTAFLFFGGGPRAAIVTVPDLRTLNASRAQRLVERGDLVFEVTDSLPNGRIPRGAVVAQTPLPGREVAPETPVRVILSRGPERRAVPAVESYPRKQAERILVATGFRVVVHAVPHARGAGRVVGTLPAAGGTVQMPGTVRLLISAGPPQVAVPPLVGRPRSEAEALLSQAGLRVGTVTAELRPDVPEGVVLSQYPAPGDSITAGRGVDLRVGTHVPPVEPEPAPELEEPAPAAPEPSGIE